MIGVVMAGGEGTRLRPLTSNQPKPMVPICGKPCIEHIVELLRRHDVTDVVVTLAFLPQVIRGYLGNGSSLGVRLEYSVEESPLGTAGSVKNAAELLDDTFVVISGDALCDIDLSALVAFHRRQGGLATLALKSVENPLEFGVVITDDDGRIERFLEKPSWGQVFSDTINTGIYVIEPEVLRWIPTGEPFDFAKQLFPRLLEMGKPLYGYVLPEHEYWLDIGNLEQYRQANEDVLDGRCRVDVPGIRLKENIWLGDGVALPGVDVIEGPAFLGNYCKVEEGARIGPYAVLGPNVTAKQGAHVERSVLDGGTYVGGGAVVTGAIVGRNCDIRAHARIDAGAAIGDECSIGAESTIAPNVRVYPFKTIEAGAQVHQNLIWESRGVSTLFTGDGVEGIVNVDVTPEVAVRLGLAFGTHLERGDRIAASRDGHPAARMIKRAMIAGINATGVHISDLRVAAPAMSRHEIKSSRLAGGMHVSVTSEDPETIEILFFGPGGVLASDAWRRDIERYYTRQEFRRSTHADIGALTYPARAVETYAEELVGILDRDVVARRGFRCVIDYGHTASSWVVPGIMGALGVEVIGLNAGPDGGVPRRNGAARQAERLVTAAGADLGVVFSPSGEYLWLIDEQARPVPPDQTLFLLVALAVRRGLQGRIAVPITVSEQVERIVAGSEISIVRTAAKRAQLARVAAEPDVLFAGADGGGFVFARFLPAFDALATLCRVLELWAPDEEPLSALLAQLPPSTLVHADVHCPWALKGTAMRLLIESTKELETESLDGLKVRENGGWVELLPDPDRPLFHIYAEGSTPEDSEELVERYRRELARIVDEHAPA
jgi:mannose-1-phosphate guanylyltransferase/phosphomannomutase